MITQRTTTDPSIIRQAGELLSESGEVPPYATDFVPPYPFLPMGTPSGGVGGLGTATGGAFTQMPTTFDVSVIRGDAVTFSYFFQDKCWTPTAPAGTPSVPWEQHWWNAQVRNPNAMAGYDPCCWYNRWIPVFGLYPDYWDWFSATLLAEFDCTATFTENFGGLVGTLITLHLDSAEMIHFPSTHYRWDLQSATEQVMTDDVPPVFDYYEGVRTWLQGAFTIAADYTVMPEKVTL